MPTTEQFKEFLASAGIPDASEDLIQHFSVFVGAMKIHAERSQAYGSAWRNYGAMSNLLSMARKIDRLMEVHWFGQQKIVFHKDELDDALDVLNYTVFFMRNIVADNHFGNPQERPAEDPWEINPARPISERLAYHDGP